MLVSWGCTGGASSSAFQSHVCEWQWISFCQQEKQHSSQTFTDHCDGTRYGPISGPGCGPRTRPLKSHILHSNGRGPSRCHWILGLIWGQKLDPGVAGDLTWHELEGKGIRGGIPFRKSRMYNTMAIMFVPHPSPQGGPLPYR